MSKLRDVVVVRVSEKGDREDEHFHSPEVQVEAARRWARDRGERLVASPIPEIDVSGRLPLSRRPGLLAAIEMIEAGRADQLVVAYFDRLVRSLKVQLEVIERVERAGGEIFALDHGKLTNGTAAQRLSTNMLGSVFQYFAEITGEKVMAAQARAVARGVYPHPKIPVGYVRGENGVLVVEPAAAKGRGAGVRAPRPGCLVGGDPGVAGRERDRARDLRCGLGAALADVSGRGPLRRPAQPERP
jgi:DNA invertase Pin-like site-specific DNA recombinase